jgi:hypothetical protein
MKAKKKIFISVAIIDVDNFWLYGIIILSLIYR